MKCRGKQEEEYENWALAFPGIILYGIVLFAAAGLNMLI